jgi:hypothetical protein
MFKLKSILFLFSILTSLSVSSQSDEDMLKKIYKTSLQNGKSYEWLDYLSNQIGGRLSGSLSAEKAVKWTKEELDSLGLDKVWLQPVMVPKWIRGIKEYAYIETSSGKTTTVDICALGGSMPTPVSGLKANIVEVKSFEELEKLGKEVVEGKIVFYNRPMQNDLINTFEAYGGCVNQRYKGAVEATKYGAVGVIVRSMNLRLDDFPHTGSMTYDDLPVSKRIPSAAISTNDAELLSAMIKLEASIKFYFKQSCRQLKDVLSHNVIGEITGSEFPNQYMLVGGHLDSWDLGEGAHDDGTGIVQSLEVAHLLKKNNINLKNTLRVVFFMNEENGTRGAKKYAELAKLNGENHIGGLESDAGGHTPRGFSIDANSVNTKLLQSWKKLLSPYGLHDLDKGGSGADISPLKGENVTLVGYRPDSQRYFDHHHASTDTFDAVNKRELELGAATMTALVYLFDKYGVNALPQPSKIKN